MRPRRLKVVMGLSSIVLCGLPVWAVATEETVTIDLSRAKPGKDLSHGYIGADGEAWPYCADYNY